jgi:hypothetical protein
MKTLPETIKAIVHREFIVGFKSYQDYFDDADGTNDLAHDFAVDICNKHGEPTEDKNFDPDESPIYCYLIDELWSAMKDEMDEMR